MGKFSYHNAANVTMVIVADFVKFKCSEIVFDDLRATTHDALHT